MASRLPDVQSTSSITSITTSYRGAYSNQWPNPNGTRPLRHRHTGQVVSLIQSLPSPVISPAVIDRPTAPGSTEASTSPAPSPSQNNRLPPSPSHEDDNTPPPSTSSHSDSRLSPSPSSSLADDSHIENPTDLPDQDPEYDPIEHATLVALCERVSIACIEARRDRRTVAYGRLWTPPPVPSPRPSLQRPAVLREMERQREIEARQAAAVDNDGAAAAANDDLARQAAASNSGNPTQPANQEPGILSIPIGTLVDFLHIRSRSRDAAPQARSPAATDETDGPSRQTAPSYIGMDSREFEFLHRFLRHRASDSMATTEAGELFHFRVREADVNGNICYLLLPLSTNNSRDGSMAALVLATRRRIIEQNTQCCMYYAVPVANKTGSTEGDNCPICINDLGYETLVRRLPCKHIFHKDCIDLWLATNPTCALCRNNLLEESS